MRKKSKRVTTSDTTVFATELGQISGIGNVEVSRLTTKGELSRNAEGGYLLWESMQKLLELERDNAHPEENAVRLRMLEAKTKLQELLLAEREGQTTTVESALREFRDAIGRLRSQLLTVPRKSSVLLTDVMTPPEREEVIKRILYDAMHEVANFTAPTDEVSDE